MKSRMLIESERSGALSDADLVLAARRGDKRAFVEIVARHQAMVCGIALGILGDFGASEDAGQEAFLTAWRKIHELREPVHLRAWLAQIARNAALGQLRRKRGTNQLDENLVLIDDSPTPDVVAATEEEAELVRQSLAKLPETYRLPLVLYYRDGQSVRGVAEALGISEDAVKQRLARGREMFRDRISGLVEGVLKRSAPSAVFTMAIAAAIGALAAPAAVAAGVFTVAGTAAAGTAAGSTTTSFLSAMSTSKAFLAAAALVAVVCIPVGYQIHTSASLPPKPRQSLASAENPGAAVDQSAPHFENSSLFAEWRALHEKYGTNGQAMLAIYKAITAMKDPFRRQSFRAALISEWAQVDPAGGLAFFLGKGPDANQRQQFFGEWLARDPQAAVSSLLAAGEGWDKIGRECLTDIARRVPARVPEIVSLLPATEEYWDNSVRDAFAIVAEGDLSAARKAAEAMTGPNREQALSGVARAWAKSDVNAAIAWAKALPQGTDQNEVVRAALVGAASVNPAAALDLVGIVPAGGRYAYFASSTGARVLAEAAKTDFDATVAWVASNPGHVGREDLFGLAHIVTEKLNADPAGFLATQKANGTLAALVPAIESALMNDSSAQRARVWDWLKDQPENDTTRALRNEVLNSASWQDPALALQLVRDLPNNAEGNAAVKEIARCLFNGGQFLHRFDALLTQAPDRLRQPLIESAFSSLNGETLDNPQKWINRLTLLPDSARATATESIARAWAQQMPEEAIVWASSLAPGDTRNGADGAIASAWAKTDAYAAADWVASLSPGADRDRGAESLVLAVADKYPREAWEWALSISDATERDRAAAQAVRAMAARDPATARQWIESGPFTAQTKVDLQAAIQKAAHPSN